MQPLLSTTIRRPFHWGIVIISAPEEGGDIPDVLADHAVTANEHGLVVLVRHAQDTESFEGDFEWAEAAVHVRLLVGEEVTSVDRRQLYTGKIRMPTGRITVGDADGEVVLPGHEGWTNVAVTVSADVAPGDHSPEAIRVDLTPVE